MEILIDGCIKQLVNKDYETKVEMCKDSRFLHIVTTKGNSIIYDDYHVISNYQLTQVNLTNYDNEVNTIRELVHVCIAIKNSSCELYEKFLFSILTFYDGLSNVSAPEKFKLGAIILSQSVKYVLTTDNNRLLYVGEYNHKEHTVESDLDYLVDESLRDACEKFVDCVSSMIVCSHSQHEEQENGECGK